MSHHPHLHLQSLRCRSSCWYVKLVFLVSIDLVAQIFPLPFPNGASSFPKFRAPKTSIRCTTVCFSFDFGWYAPAWPIQHLFRSSSAHASKSPSRSFTRI